LGLLVLDKIAFSLSIYYHEALKLLLEGYAGKGHHCLMLTGILFLEDLYSLGLSINVSKKDKDDKLLTFSRLSFSRSSTSTMLSVFFGL
jgi:hypothetical protein